MTRGLLIVIFFMLLSVVIAMPELPEGPPNSPHYGLRCNENRFHVDDITAAANKILTLGEDPLTLRDRGRALVEVCGNKHFQCVRVSLRALDNISATAKTHAVVDAMVKIRDACGGRGGSRSASFFPNMVVHIHYQWV